MVLQALERQAEQLQAEIAAAQAELACVGQQAEAAELRVRQLEADVESDLATKVRLNLGTTDRSGPAWKAGDMHVCQTLCAPPKKYAGGAEHAAAPV